MKYVLAIALVPLALVELILRAVFMLVCVFTILGLLLLLECGNDGVKDLLRPSTFDLIREVIA